MFDEERIKYIYGSTLENWGDRAIFQGDYINFGYYSNISISKNLTINNRISSSYLLYEYVIRKLNISKNDSVLEIGCGRGVGMMRILPHISMKKLIGIDITPEQILRAKIKKTESEIYNLQVRLQLERRELNLESWEKRVNSSLTYTIEVKEKFKQNNEWLYKKAEELRKKEQNLQKKIKVMENNVFFNWFLKSVNFISKLFLNVEMCSLERDVLSLREEKLAVHEEIKAFEWQIRSLSNDIRNETILEKSYSKDRTAVHNAKKINEWDIKVTDERVNKINSISLSVASAYSTGLKDNSIDKIFAVEVIQHIGNFSIFVKEISRILAPQGKAVFCAHLATNDSSYNKLKQDDLLGDSIFLPFTEVVDAFKAGGFYNVNVHSIGEDVFEGFNQWVQSYADEISGNLSNSVYTTYKAGLIDYYVFEISGGKQNDTINM